MEATGGYEKAAAEKLIQAGYATSIINPRMGRRFAQAIGQLAKTDKIDSQVLALYAQKIEPKAKAKFCKNNQLLVDIKARRSQLLPMIGMERSRLETGSTDVKKSLAKSLKYLKKELKQVDKDLQESIKGIPNMPPKISSCKVFVG